MSEPRERLKSICIAGAGQVAVITALALRRALPDAQITVLGLPLDPAAFADRAASALPFTNKLHDRLGIAEELLIQRAGGSHRLLTRYFGWGAEGQSGAMAYGAQLDAELRTRFANEWGGGRSNGGGGNSSGGNSGGGNSSGTGPAGSLAEVLAEAGRFAVPPGDMPTPLDDLDYALRWNLQAYREILIAMAQQMGVTYIQGEIAALEPDGEGGLAVIAVAGQGQGQGQGQTQGQTQGKIEADLFVDCSGPAARLLSALPGAKREDWSGVLPRLRLLNAKPAQGMLALEDRWSLLPEGWLMEFAGVDGLQVTLGIADGVSEDAALKALNAEPAEMVTLAPGCAKEAWAGNVVALGDAAASFEPVGHLNLDLAHRQLDLLLEMLPGKQIEPLERAEFNRRAAMMATQVRDTLATHYAAPRAWQVFGERAVPESLVHVLDQFARRGRLPFRDEAALLTQEYMALLGALGFPAGVTPQSLAQDPREADAARAKFEEQARAALQFAPPYQQYMMQLLQPQGQQTGGPSGAGGISGDLQY